MNHLLHQLETKGYLTRAQQPDSTAHDHRSHIVRLTDRGWAASAAIRLTTARLDRDWRRAVGEDAYADLAQGLERLQEVIDSEAPCR
jgi:DNA-binding MarR family transcriptional regulator